MEYLWFIMIMNWKEHVEVKVLSEILTLKIYLNSRNKFNLILHLKG